MDSTLRQRGFTLVELLVTLALVAVLMNVATPSFVAFQRNAEMTSLANTLLASLNAARSEAMKRNRSAIVAPNDLKLWESGWVIYVDADGSGTFDASQDIVLQRTAALPSYIEADATGSAKETQPSPQIRFWASGFRDNTNNPAGLINLTLTIQRKDVANAAKEGQARRLVIAITGRARVCKPTSDTDPNCEK